MTTIKDSKITAYCKHLRRAHVEVLCYDRKKKVWYWDLPAMAVICFDKNHKNPQKGFAHKPSQNGWHSFLKKKLEKNLGNIGDHPKIGKHYIIGNCAEQHAGNIFMNKYSVKNTNELYFSKAVRPRTMEVHPYCDNCKKIFENLQTK